MNRAMDVLDEFPVRKNKKQKENFRRSVQTYGEQRDYKVSVEKGLLGAKNIVIGNPETAKYVVTAHYDTCAQLPFPNLCTPTNFWAFLGWQLVLVLLLGVPVVVVGELLGHLFRIPDKISLIMYILLLAEILMVAIGPANHHNANDNTSGVVTVLSLMEHLPQELRQDVCFVLFDLEEAGLWGSLSYAKAHKMQVRNQLILNADCVGDGKTLLFVPTKKLKKQKDRMEQLDACLKNTDTMELRLHRKGFAVYPSDQANFPYALGIAAMQKTKGGMLYMDKIHTKRDQILDENNITVLQETLIRVIREQV